MTVAYRNHYRCPYDDTVWVDDWDSMCNDHCPECDAEIQPFHSERLVPMPLESAPDDSIPADRI